MNFLARTQETQGKLVEGQAHPQRTITTFFHPITPTNATSKSRDTQMGSRLGRNTRATINRAIVICRARRLQSHGPLPLHPCHRQLKAIISPHRKHFPRFETSPFWIDLCQRSFKENCQIIFNLRISHVSKTRSPRLLLSYLLLYSLSNIYFILIILSLSLPSLVVLGSYLNSSGLSPDSIPTCPNFQLQISVCPKFGIVSFCIHNEI